MSNSPMETAAMMVASPENGFAQRRKPSAASSWETEKNQTNMEDGGLDYMHPRRTKRALSLTEASLPKLPTAPSLGLGQSGMAKPVFDPSMRRNSLQTAPVGPVGSSRGYITRWHSTAASPFIQRSISAQRKQENFPVVAAQLNGNGATMPSNMPWSPRSQDNNRPSLTVEIPKPNMLQMRSALASPTAITSPMSMSALASPTMAALSTPTPFAYNARPPDMARLYRQTSEELLFGASDSPPPSPFSLISPANAGQQAARVFVWGNGISPDLAGFSEAKTLMKKNDPRSKSKGGGAKGKHCPPAPDRNSRKGPPLRRKNSLWESKVLSHFATPQDVPPISSSNFVNWKFLGEGGFCQVYRALDATDGQAYAIKKAKTAYRGRKDREMHLKEVEVAAKIPPHPNVLRYYQAWQEDGLFHLATELCDGNLDSLVKEYIKDGSGSAELPQDFLVNVCRQTARALRHIHRAKVLHLDLKPENILVKAQEGLLKLGDFGHSKSKNEWRDGEEGDRTYMAPELLEPDAQPNEAADIFSLGLLLFELATGRDLPEKGPLWSRLRDGSPRTAQFLAAKSKISPAFQELLMSCMRPNPTLRPNADAILDKLADFPDVPFFTALGVQQQQPAPDLDAFSPAFSPNPSNTPRLSIQVPSFKRAPSYTGPESPCTPHANSEPLPFSFLAVPSQPGPGMVGQSKRTERRALQRLNNNTLMNMARDTGDKDKLEKLTMGGPMASPPWDQHNRPSSPSAMMTDD